jgi:hypothetical protein
MRFCTYSECLFNLKLDCVLCRRLEADLIICFKILHGLVDIDFSCSVARSFCTSARGNSFKLVQFLVVSERDENCLLIVLLIFEIPCLILL